LRIDTHIIAKACTSCFWGLAAAEFRVSRDFGDDDDYMRDIEDTYQLLHSLHACSEYRMVSETDPLLPKGSSAPEISGYGFSRPSKTQCQTQSEVVDQYEDVEARDKEQANPNTASFLPLRTLISLFVIVVGLAFFITLLAPGAIHTPGKKLKNDPVTISARVDDILSENPLIGPHIRIEGVVRNLIVK